MEERQINQAVILAGGLGTRLQPFTNDNPKPLYKIQGIPFIEYLICQIQEFGIQNILLLLGYKAEKIQNYLGDGSRFGVQISYDITPAEYNTGDRIKHAQDKIHKYFLLMYCDNYCPVDYEKLVSEFFQKQSYIQLSAYENKERYTKDNLLISESGKVEIYDKKRLTPGLQGVDIGYAIIDKMALQYIKCDGQNFEAMVYPQVQREGKLYATVTRHRYYSIGSWERIKLTELFFNSIPTVFLDRDGTINVRAAKACYIEKPEEFIWIDGAREAIKLLKDNGYRVIIVSNQPGIARGNLTEETLQEIHEKMQDELAQIGAAVDKIYVCPHNWEEKCECRKPKPGMLYQAQKEFSLNLTKCIMVGDDERDIEAGKQAGCKTYMVTEEETLLKVVKMIIGRK